MKKALIILFFFAVIVLIWVFNPFGNVIVLNAAGTNEISAVSLTGTTASFMVPRTDIDQVVVEYAYLVDQVLVSKLKTIDVTSSTGVYSFQVPEGTKAYRIWRLLIKNGDQWLATSPSGTTEYKNGSYTIANVQTRLKTIYIEDDLITSESVQPDEDFEMAGIRAWKKFTMYFSTVDALGNTIPIDRIASIAFSYDIKKTILGITTTTHKDVVINETTLQRTGSWPWLFSQEIVTRIKPANRIVLGTGEIAYFWEVDLGTYSYTAFIGNVSLDETTIITIDYYYQGVFYDDAEVVDVPYDEGDIQDVNPDWQVDESPDFLGWFMENWKTIINVVLIIVAISLAGKIFGFLGGILAFLKDIALMTAKAIGFVIRILSIVVFYTLKTLFYWVPIGIGKALYFLFVPASKRRRKPSREVIIYDH